MDPIYLAKAAVMGIVEGITEFIPVSSTGHLIVIQNVLGLANAGTDPAALAKENAFAIFIQLGAILAVIWLYWRKLLSLLLGWVTDAKARWLIANIVIATIPAVVVGLPTADWIEAHFFRPVPVALAFVLGGVAILLIEGLCHRATVDSIDDIPWPRALGVGLVQILSILFPGTSRSGATIMGGLSLGLSRRAATEFSFFLAIPAMIGASAVKLHHVRHDLSSADVPFFAVGFVVAFLAALPVVRWLVRYVSSHSFRLFAWYRIAFGILILALFWSRGSF
jgi:undecaprenyl-diphosphatase